MKYSLIYPKLKIQLCTSQTTQVCVTTKLSENEQCLMCFYMPMKKTCFVCYIYNTWLDCCRITLDPSPTDNIWEKLWIFWRLKEQFSLVSAAFPPLEVFSLGFLLSFGWSFLFFIRLFVAVAAPLKCLGIGHLVGILIIQCCKFFRRAHFW